MDMGAGPPRATVSDGVTPTRSALHASRRGAHVCSRQRDSRSNSSVGVDAKLAGETYTDVGSSADVRKLYCLVFAASAEMTLIWLEGMENASRNACVIRSTDALDGVAASESTA